MEDSDGFTERWLCCHDWCFAILQFLKSLMDLRGEGPVQDLGEASVLCCFCFPFVTRTRQWMRIVVTARCLVKRCECRGCHGTDDWKEHADGFSLRTAFEVVSCRLEVQRQVDEISAVQCRKMHWLRQISVQRALRMLWHIVMYKCGVSRTPM